MAALTLRDAVVAVAQEELQCTTQCKGMRKASVLDNINIVQRRALSAAKAAANVRVDYATNWAKKKVEAMVSFVGTRLVLDSDQEASVLMALMDLLGEARSQMLKSAGVRTINALDAATTRLPRRRRHDAFLQPWADCETQPRHRRQKDLGEGENGMGARVWWIWLRDPRDAMSLPATPSPPAVCNACVRRQPAPALSSLASTPVSEVLQAVSCKLAPPAPTPAVVPYEPVPAVLADTDFKARIAGADADAAVVAEPVAAVAALLIVAECNAVAVASTAAHSNAVAVVSTAADSNAVAVALTAVDSNAVAVVSTVTYGNAVAVMSTVTDGNAVAVASTVTDSSAVGQVHKSTVCSKLKQQEEQQHADAAEPSFQPATPPREEQPRRRPAASRTPFATLAFKLYESPLFSSRSAQRSSHQAAGASSGGLDNRHVRCIAAPSAQTRVLGGRAARCNVRSNSAFIASDSGPLSWGKVRGYCSGDGAADSARGRTATRTSPASASSREQGLGHRMDVRRREQAGKRSASAERRRNTGEAAREQQAAAASKRGAWPGLPPANAAPAQDGAAPPAVMLPPAGCQPGVGRCRSGIPAAPAQPAAPAAWAAGRSGIPAAPHTAAMSAAPAPGVLASLRPSTAPMARMQQPQPAPKQQQQKSRAAAGAAAKKPSPRFS